MRGCGWGGGGTYEFYLDNPQRALQLSYEELVVENQIAEARRFEVMRALLAAERENPGYPKYYDHLKRLISPAQSLPCNLRGSISKLGV